MSLLKRTAVVAVALVGLFGQPAGAQRPPSSKWVEFKPGGLMGGGDALAMVYGVANISKQPVWVLAEFNSPGGDRLCEFLKKIEPGASTLFECAVAAIMADQRYPLKLSVYSDDRLASRVERFEPTFRTSQQELTSFEKLRAATTDTRPTPLANVDDGAASADLPTTFEPTWYRRLQRGFSLKAYEDSGQLTVSVDTLVFTAGEKVVRIPLAQITSVRLAGVPRDIANDWVVVRFTGDDQKPDGVGFKDGSGLGNGKGTGVMYLTIRRATRK